MRKVELFLIFFFPVGEKASIEESQERKNEEAAEYEDCLEDKVENLRREEEETEGRRKERWREEEKGGGKREEEERGRGRKEGGGGWWWDRAEEEGGRIKQGRGGVRRRLRKSYCSRYERELYI